MLALLALPLLPVLVHLSRHTSRLTVISRGSDMSNIKPTRNWLDWIIDHDFIVGGMLCALPVLIVIAIMFML